MGRVEVLARVEESRGKLTGVKTGVSGENWEEQGTGEGEMEKF